MSVEATCLGDVYKSDGLVVPGLCCSCTEKDPDII